MLFSKTRIRKAGEKLKTNEQDNESLEVLSYWRGTHALPLEIAYEYLKVSALKTDKKSLLAKRLKRTPSIISKLKRFDKEGMKLDRMNDIAGCRAILPTLKKVNQVNKRLIQQDYFKRHKDYIKEPKDSGYRGIHLIAKIKNGDKDFRPIELQLRTKIQHSWATAIEIVDLFANQSIKINAGGKNWSRFFKHTSEVFALLEENSYINLAEEQSVFNNFEKLYVTSHKNIKELSFFRSYKLGKKLKVLKRFDAFTSSLKVTAEQINKIPEAGYVLINIDEVDGKSFAIRSEFFPISNLELAIKEYLKSEKKTFLHENFITALVSTDSIAGIKEAYPNYFADSTSFIKYFNIVMTVYEKYNPAWYRMFCSIKYIMKY